MARKGQPVQTYTVYERRPAPENIERRVAKMVFVKEGFSFYAFLSPSIWLIVNHMWWEVAAFVGLSIILSGAMVFLGTPQEVTAVVNLGINLIFAFEARDLHRYSLERRGYLLIAVIAANSLDEAERRFLQEWLPAGKADHAQLTSMPGMDTGSGQAKPYRTEPVIGMFPTHGG